MTRWIHGGHITFPVFSLSFPDAISNMFLLMLLSRLPWMSRTQDKMCNAPSIRLWAGGAVSAFNTVTLSLTTTRVQVFSPQRPIQLVLL